MYAAKEPKKLGLWDSIPELNIRIQNIETADYLKWTNE